MMNKHLGTALLMTCGLLTLHAVANAAESPVPEPFQGYDNDSTYSISYDDFSALLRTVVVDVGRSTRKIPAPPPDVTGTRMKVKISKTANEGNRFYYETFKGDDEAKAYLVGIQKSLEELPTEAPLKHFSRDEQLAYWMNLYNVTVLNEIIAVYPKNNIKKLVQGKKSIFAKKSLTVAGVSLSLNDIQFTILSQNYDNNPLIMYGLYQGIVGGPSIRKTAYTGANVYDALEDNAYEFVNSNRGTFIRDEKTFRVSSLYGRDKAYFPDFNADLSNHLMVYLVGKERGALEGASKIKVDINDWNVTDLGGSQQRIGGSFADSKAALMDSVKGTTPMDGGGVMGAADGYASTSMAAGGTQRSLSRIDPALLQVLLDINEQREAENQRSATVAIEDLEDDEVAPPADETTDTEEDE